MNPPEVPPLAPPPPQQGLGGCMMAFLIVLGIALLLPGLCSLGVLVAVGGNGSPGPLALLWLLAFAVAAGGVALIVFAVRKR